MSNGTPPRYCIGFEEERVSHPQRPEDEFRDCGLEALPGHNLDDPSSQPEARVVVRPERAKRQDLRPVAERRDSACQRIVALPEVGFLEFVADPACPVGQKMAQGYRGGDAFVGKAQVG